MIEALKEERIVNKVGGRFKLSTLIQKRLVALNAGGVELALLAVVMIIVVHAIEAYGLNPLIYGRTLRLNPVLTLIVLFVAYHAFGIWGMLLGVPTARYLLSDVLRVVLDARKA